jgi:hypothetical protein
MKWILALLLAMPAMAMDQCIKCQSVPWPAEGWSEVRIKPSSRLPVPAARDGVGAVRTFCKVSHFLWDDPILAPGKPGGFHHLHMFWGNTSADAWTTPETLVAGGNSTCRGGIENRSAYWMPAVIDSTDGSVMRSQGVAVYYKTGYTLGRPGNRRNEDVQPPPAGITLATKPGATDYYIECGRTRTKTFVDCGLEREVKIVINLPQCWDGKNLSTPDGSHMAYASRGQNGCPTTHPVPLPQITYLTSFTIPMDRTTETWALSSDMPWQAGGSTMHADWMNGWTNGREEKFTRDIINKGLDGGSHHAGNGEEWF